jgi:uncharacterized membrane protein HdeD (DUF308 family)
MSATTSVTIGRESVGWSIGISILMIVAGFLAITLPQAAGIAVNLFVGWMLLFSGVMHFVYAWQGRHNSGFVWELLLGVLYVVIGGYLLINPIRGLVTLTLALAFYLWIEGVLEFVLSYMMRTMPGAGWILFDAIVSVVLAVLIWRSWPWSTEWAIGTLVGISMLFSGISRLMFTIATRRRMATKLA